MKALRLAVLAFCCWFIQPAHAQVPILNSYPQAAAVLFLDFDGHLVDGTNWNMNGPIFCGPSNLNTTQVTEVFNRVSEDYRPFNLNVTTDSAVYEAAPIDKRIRVVLTITSDWYGVAGGVAYTNSFTWGNNTPCFVFTALHRYNVKNIAEAASHEAGHTFGLRHQAAYDSTCRKTAEYNSGVGGGAEGWAPIMGVGYYRNKTTWHYGPNPYSCTSDQDDLAVLTSEHNGFGYRVDDDTAATFNQAVALNSDTAQLVGSGLISTNTDTDLFKFFMPASGPVSLQVKPFSIAANDEGSNLDVQLQLFDKNGTLINIFNPDDRLSASLDTSLSYGTYYIAVSGASGTFASNYASLGAYSIDGSVPVPGPLSVQLQPLKGFDANPQLRWVVDAEVAVTAQIIERSEDGKAFDAVASLQPGTRSFGVHTDNDAQYRVQISFENGRTIYSNSITIQNTNPIVKTALQTNVIHNQTLLVKSGQPCSYAITDASGHVLQRGTIAPGTVPVIVPNLHSGMYQITFQHEGTQTTQKFLRL